MLEATRIMMNFFDLYSSTGPMFWTQHYSCFSKILYSSLTSLNVLSFIPCGFLFRDLHTQFKKFPLANKSKTLFLFKFVLLSKLRNWKSIKENKERCCRLHQPRLIVTCDDVWKSRVLGGIDQIGQSFLCGIGKDYLFSCWSCIYDFVEISTSMKIRLRSLKVEIDLWIQLGRI